jgi:hypothetical protein
MVSQSAISTTILAVNFYFTGFEGFPGTKSSNRPTGQSLLQQQAHSSARVLRIRGRRRLFPENSREIFVLLPSKCPRVARQDLW